MRRALLVGLLVGCVPSQRELRAPVDADIEKRLATKVDVVAPDAVAALLAQPLDQNAAVKIALANSPRLRAALSELGIAGGELASAIGLGPLEVSATYRFHSDNEIEIIQNIEGLFLAPRRRAAARAGLVAARARAAATALRLVARVEIAFHDLIAAQQALELRQTAFDAADAAAVVRERMHAAGNTSDLALARDRDAREQARIDLGRAQAAVEIQREQINALLGLTGAQTKWTATGTLPDAPDSAPSLDDLEQAAVSASLDLSAGRAALDSATNRAGSESVRRWLPHLGVGWAIEEYQGEWWSGPTVSLGIPLFDSRAGVAARARAEVARADAELSAEAVELRADARAARVAALAAFQEARHLRTVVLPLRQQIVDQVLLHYNAMDADPFELIVARRQLAEGGQQYLDALRRYANATSEITALRRGVHLGIADSRAMPTMGGTNDGHP